MISLSAASSRADLLPTCAQKDTLITCAAADEGKPCQGGGKCYAMPCSPSAGPVTMVYKCDVCPTIVDSPDAGCSPSNIGTPCSDGGTCNGINSYCNPTPTRFVCATPGTGKPTGPPGGGNDGGTAGTGGSSGCEVAPRGPGPRAIGLGLLGLGTVLVFVDRMRRRAR
jgi:hypothetical protein